MCMAKSNILFQQLIKNNMPVISIVIQKGGSGKTTTAVNLAAALQLQGKNILLVELPNGDWAKTILKLFFFSSYQYYLYQKLIGSFDKQLSAIAEKSLKEVTYHVRWCSEWVIRMGDGTNESKQRIEKALEELWSYTSEMFLSVEYEIECAKNNIGVDVTALKNDWENKVKEIFAEATLSFPCAKQTENAGGKDGKHTEYLKEILKDMQYLQRAYPGCEW